MIERKQELNKALMVIETLMDARPNMPVRAAAMLLVIAMNEGVTVKGLLKRMHLPRERVLRQVRVMSSENVGLIELGDQTRLQERSVILSEKGRDLIREISYIMR